MVTIIKRGPHQYQAKVRRDLMVLASVFNIARYDLQLPIDNDILKLVLR